MRKVCRTCGKRKAISQFYVHPQMADGHLNKCKTCVRNRVSKHRSVNIDDIRAYDRERGRTEKRLLMNRERAKANESRQAVTRTKWASRNQHKVKATQAVRYAVITGRLRKMPCWCGDTRSQGHHPDYSKPLEVVWLCQKHHKELHRKYA